ncbi:MAG: phospho-sugar mutase [Microbacterium sp.]|uniref:phospho-sugar mutase n=1 Tax=Microbacterium sp. TaxID=51671 RepID=UPI0027171CDE|nr:phospho-sugar mutase [Microbacterium sp.]MDO8382290.1 phospho-sugar mutase [Microbacterium sp.]
MTETIPWGADAAASADPALEAARAWLAEDPDPETRDELAGLIERAEGGDAEASASLHDRFDTRLAFGTAGLRGELGAGSNRMNRVLVAQSAAGLAAFVRDRVPASTPETPASIVIGYDGRKNSAVFARDSAEIFAGAGLRAILLPRMLPTPVLAFAVRHLGADAGVMVTASHNPPRDNGYKVYLGGEDDGAQIVSPADAEIAARIDDIAADVPVSRIPRSLGFEVPGEDILDAYVAQTAATAPAPEGARDLRWVYTAMHGVGHETLDRLLSTAGYPAPITVDAQIAPDPDFPTVAFPNPEEPGAMDLAIEAAVEAGAELILANDPDADRLAVAIPDGAGGWRRLSGNDVGLLLGWRAARQARAAGAPEGSSLACSLVSSPGLAAIAGHYGLDFHETLTGFKWISRAPGMVFGFEEALGYLVDPHVVRDKDGLSAAVALLELAVQARASGSTLGGMLADMATQFGHFASAQVSMRVDDLAVIGHIMARLRAEHPTDIGGIHVSRVDDLLEGSGALPPGDVVRLWLDDGSRLIVRPSGTEPKLKVYIDVRGDSAEDAASRTAALEDASRALIARLQG